MNLVNLIDLLNVDLRNEWKHLLFYMNAANVLQGMERLFLVDILKEHASSEMEHVYQFAHKIRGKGFVPSSGLAAHPFPENITTAKEVVAEAIKMEQEVVANYHLRHQQATEVWESLGKKEHYDIVIFLEEQIEHSQHDVEEWYQIQAGF